MRTRLLSGFSRRNIVMADRGCLALHYRGGEADSGEIGYYTVASSMMAFGNLVETASDILWGDTIVEIKVRKISPTNSIEFDFVINLVPVAQTVITQLSPGDIWSFLKDGISAWKFLKGSPPQKMERHGDKIHVTNIYGDVETLNQNTTILVTNPKAGDTVKRLFKNPMDQCGINQVILQHEDQKDEIVIDSKEKECFTNVSPDGETIESTTECVLSIESIRFREKNKWEFTDGQVKLNAEITDKQFLSKIEDGEPFSKGDVLVVDLHRVQRIKGKKFVTQYEIVKVKEHRSNVRNLKI